MYIFPRWLFSKPGFVFLRKYPSIISCLQIKKKNNFHSFTFSIRYFMYDHLGSFSYSCFWLHQSNFITYLWRFATIPPSITSSFAHHSSMCWKVLQIDMVIQQKSFLFICKYMHIFCYQVFLIIRFIVHFD